jgi:hypothetical protein
MRAPGCVLTHGDSCKRKQFSLAAELCLIVRSSSLHRRGTAVTIERVEKKIHGNNRKKLKLLYCASNNKRDELCAVPRKTSWTY